MLKYEQKNNLVKQNFSESFRFFRINVKNKKKSGMFQFIVHKFGFITNISIQLKLMNINQAIINYEEDDSLFTPIGRKRAEKKMNRSRKSSKFNSSIWVFAQNQKYVQFLIQQKSTMQNAQERKQSRVFVRMSQFLKGRSPEQCRSHHQKIMKNYHSIQNIIANLLKVKEARLVQKTNQKQQLPNESIQQWQEQPILQKQQTTIQFMMMATPEATMSQIQDVWEMIDQNMWIR